MKRRWIFRSEIPNMPEGSFRVIEDMDNQMGEAYLYIEETPGEHGQYVQEFTNQEDLRIFAKGRMRADPRRVGRGYRMKPNNTPKEIML